MGTEGWKSSVNQRFAERNLAEAFYRHTDAQGGVGRRVAGHFVRWTDVRSQRICGVSEHSYPEVDEVSLTAVNGPRRSLQWHELETKYKQVELAEDRQWWAAEIRYAARYCSSNGAVFVLTVSPGWTCCWPLTITASSIVSPSLTARMPS